MRGRRGLRIAGPLLVAGLLVGCGEGLPPEEGEAPANAQARGARQGTSLLGEPLYARVDTAGAVAEADARLAKAPDDVDRIIEAGRVRRNFWRYREAMELYSSAAELAPDDWRPYRFRGHRHISVREFEEAVEDLEKARELAPLNWDVAYHLGLAYFLSGRFGDAADEYLRCLGLAGDPAARAAEADDFRNCSENATDPESFVAMAEWAVRGLLRSGREEEARGLLADVADDLPIEENLAYYHDLLFYKGLKEADELLSPGEDAPYRLETVGMGVANWLLVQGDTARAMEIFREVARHPWWPGFGRIAAEVEVARAGGGS